LHGVDVAYSALEKTVGLKPDGNSFLDLRNAATRYGVRSGVFTLDGPLGALKPEIMPVVVCIPMGRQDVPTECRLPGHYYVVLGMNAGNVELIDATIGQRQMYPQWYFRRSLDANPYVLARAETGVPWTALAVASTLASGFALAFFILSAARPRAK
jgi:ABC-type bacteriocin/lantibiotic exporter with double-glycine peptidase domain